jgi:hypothetical protein
LGTEPSSKSKKGRKPKIAIIMKPSDEANDDIAGMKDSCFASYLLQGIEDNLTRANSSQE